jgi:hypothetical protein
MKKRIYRRMPVNDFQPDSISHADLGGKLVFAIDVAKVDMVAALAAADGRVLHTPSAGRHPSRIPQCSPSCAASAPPASPSKP